MYGFIVIDSGWRREVIKVAALDDQDAIKLGKVYFESDAGLRWLEVVTPAGTTLTASVRTDAQLSAA